MLQEVFTERFESDPTVIGRVIDMIPIPKDCDLTTRRRIAASRIKTLYDGGALTYEYAESVIQTVTTASDSEIEELIW